MKSTEFWTAENVNTFNGNDVVNGEIEISNSEYEEILNDLYGDVEVCGYTFGSGSLLVDADPVAFRVGKNDYESAIQTELEDQLERGDSSGIEFVDGDEYDLDNDDDEEENDE